MVLQVLFKQFVNEFQYEMLNAIPGTQEFGLGVLGWSLSLGRTTKMTCLDMIMFKQNFLNMSKLCNTRELSGLFFEEHEERLRRESSNSTDELMWEVR